MCLCVYVLCIMYYLGAVLCIMSMYTYISGDGASTGAGDSATTATAGTGATASAGHCRESLSNTS